MQGNLKQYSGLSIRAFLGFVILAIALAGCSVNLISAYDENIDKSVTQLQKEIETFFVTIDGQNATECTYDKHKDFYKESKVAISAIEVRARAIPKNEISVEQVGLLNDSLSSMEELHKLGCLDKDQVSNLRSNFNTSITAILKLELAKKRGE